MTEVSIDFFGPIIIGGRSVEQVIGKTGCRCWCIRGEVLHGAIGSKMGDGWMYWALGVDDLSLERGN